mgnify:FL=1
MKVILIDDSRLARLELKEQLKSHQDIEVLGEASNVPEALSLIHSLSPDLIFLDIHMPQQSGFQLLEQLDQHPLLIFTTAYSEYAINSFEYDTVDYLLKPIVAKRLNKALDRARQQLETPEIEPLQPDSRIYVKEGDKNWFIQLNEVIFFESIGNYTRLHLSEAKPMVYKSLSQLEKRLPAQMFFRANRHQILNVSCISNIEVNVGSTFEVTLEQALRIEVSRRQSALFKKLWSI